MSYDQVVALTAQVVRESYPSGVEVTAYEELLDLSKLAYGVKYVHVTLASVDPVPDPIAVNSEDIAQRVAISLTIEERSRNDPAAWQDLHHFAASLSVDLALGQHLQPTAMPVITRQDGTTFTVDRDALSLVWNGDVAVAPQEPKGDVLALVLTTSWDMTLRASQWEPPAAAAGDVGPTVTPNYRRLSRVPGPQLTPPLRGLFVKVGEDDYVPVYEAPEDA